MAAILIPRSELRKTWEIKTRVEQAENDLDTHESEDNQFHARIEKKLDRLTSIAFSLMISLLTSSILLSVNLVRH